MKRVETKDADTVVVMYFDSMSRNKEYCPTVSAYRTHKVAKQKPVPVILYDYYDSCKFLDFNIYSNFIFNQV